MHAATAENENGANITDIHVHPLLPKRIWGMLVPPYLFLYIFSGVSTERKKSPVAGLRALPGTITQARVRNLLSAGLA